MPDDKPITISLTEWQKRMLRDHLEIRTVPTKLTISRIPKSDFVKYRVVDPTAFQEGSFNFYLTDPQIKTVTKSLGVDAKVSALTISPQMVKSGAIKLR